VIAMVILTPIVVLVLLMALERLEAALLPGADDETGASPSVPSSSETDGDKVPRVA
jgi:hypothetical protein